MNPTDLEALRALSKEHKQNKERIAEINRNHSALIEQRDSEAGPEFDYFTDATRMSLQHRRLEDTNNCIERDIVAIVLRAL